MFGFNYSENKGSSRASLRSTKSSTTLIHEDAPPADPLELTAAAENLESALEPQGESNNEDDETNNEDDETNSGEEETND